MRASLKTLAPKAAGTSVPPIAQLGTSQPTSHFKHALCVACLILVSSLSLTACAMQDSSNFDSATWKAQRGVDLEKNQRVFMLASMKKNLRVGMTRDEVIALLGQPDYTEQGDAMTTDAYYLGVSPYGPDTQEYDLQYRDGKLVSHHSVQG